jgi:hypothetical protein
MLEINITTALEKQLKDMQKVNTALLGLKKTPIVSIPSAVKSLPKTTTSK